jgi:hypothetical protein
MAEFQKWKKEKTWSRKLLENTIKYEQNNAFAADRKRPRPLKSGVSSWEKFKMAGPKIFVSSTCYDLSMARDQLRNFLIGLGYEPVLSEYSDVLFDPRVHTHELYETGCRG